MSNTVKLGNVRDWSTKKEGKRNEQARKTQKVDAESSQITLQNLHAGSWLTCQLLPCTTQTINKFTQKTQHLACNWIQEINLISPAL